jgi:hypothetical protein
MRDVCNAPTLTAFSTELINFSRTVEAQKLAIDELELKAAQYKALFYNKHELAEKLRKQIAENRDNRTGEFDGFCYASWRAQAHYRTIDDMFTDNLITTEEYKFCGV